MAEEGMRLERRGSDVSTDSSDNLPPQLSLCSKFDTKTKIGFGFCVVVGFVFLSSLLFRHKLWPTSE